ncbi:MAG TPA: phosphoribosylamine--glycine ligase [Spirochaetota bacterium]|nr:phosphoribosylamine--glycine ligase [Spirochaetota bacterium]
MKVLILGSGGREHALAVKLSRSPQVKEVVISPGNGGTAGEFSNVVFPLKPPYSALKDYVTKKGFDLVVVGPEALLVDGVVDHLEKEGMAVFGPSQAAARLEGSKFFAKQIMASGKVPTAAYEVFRDYDSAAAYINNTAVFPLVLKADGLAAGKGVIVCQQKEEALEALALYFKQKKFGRAGTTLVIESFLTGREASVLAFTDGKTIRTLPPSQDHKRIYDNDQGPNTGGMGVYTPLYFFNEKHQRIVEEDILKPTLKALRDKGIVYKGILYAGLMVKNDAVNVVEFNVRFGDPETQCVLPLLKSDLFEVMYACTQERLDHVNFETVAAAACTVIMASGGYPGSYEKGKVIKGLEKIKNAHVYHAGTALKNGKLVTAGGRVLALTAIDAQLSRAVETVYDEIKNISFADAYYRKDIGEKGIRP